MLNYLENTKIKQNMSDFIQHAVRQNDLQKLLLKFTDRKKNFLLVNWLTSIMRHLADKTSKRLQNWQRGLNFSFYLPIY